MGALTSIFGASPPSPPLLMGFWLGKVIGEGHFGKVMEATVMLDDGTIRMAAVKMLKDWASKAYRKDFMGELEILSKVGNHPNIVKLIGALEHQGNLCVATEYARYGDLLHFLRSYSLTSEQLLGFAADVAQGMQYLAQKGLVHRDLAARNILVCDNYVCKVTDFGLTRSGKMYVKTTAGPSPIPWMAIESLIHNVYTTKSDVWSYGVLLWEIFSLGGTPYPGMTCDEVKNSLLQGYRLGKPLNCEDEVNNLMLWCWNNQPYDRPTFQQLYTELSRLIFIAKQMMRSTPYCNGRPRPR